MTLIIYPIGYYPPLIPLLMFFQAQSSAWVEIVSFLIGIAISTLISVGVYKERIGNLTFAINEIKKEMLRAEVASESRITMLNTTLMDLTRDIGRLEGNLKDRRRP